MKKNATLKIRLTAVVSFIILITVCTSGEIEESLILKGAEFHKNGNLDGAKEIYQKVLSKKTENPDAWHLLGLVFYNEGEFDAAELYLSKAISIRPSNVVYLSNMGEVLRASSQLYKAEAYLRAAIQVDASYTAATFNLGVVLHDQGQVREAEELYRSVLADEPLHPSAVHHLSLLFQEQGRLQDTVNLWTKISSLSPWDTSAWMELGVAQQQIGRLREADLAYSKVLEIDPSHRTALTNKVSLLQESGYFEEAIHHYHVLLEDNPDDYTVLNNLGAALITMGLEEGVLYLERAVELRPKDGAMSLINLGTFYSEEGDLDLALSAYRRVYAEDRTKIEMLFRAAILLPPIMKSTQDIELSRSRFKTSVMQLMKMKSQVILQNPVKAIERTHFYLVYHGQNDREIQEMVAALYWAYCPDLKFLAPHLQNEVWEKRDEHAGFSQAPLSPNPRRKIRVGFCSKFFANHEPHGLLLEGIMRHLPRSEFEVIVFWINFQGRDLPLSLLNSADRVIKVSLHFNEVRISIAEAELDILVFADMMSEPLNHFLGHARLAPVQCLFWGNPVTSGNKNMDYFISADRLEPANRTLLAEDDEHYTEQVVLLDGQGIWYDRPRGIPPQKQRAEFGLQDDWTIFICAQSLFKLHPQYDKVLHTILQRTPHAHLVFLKGRRKKWTETFKTRFFDGSAASFAHRVHFVERQSAGDEFLQLLMIGDVVLHPFPFGGSRTSAEALSLGLPLVTQRTQFLRGRMAASFLITMGLEDLITETSEEYIELAVKLGTYPDFRAQVSQRIEQNVDGIWEDGQVVDEWAKFLRTAVFLADPTTFTQKNFAGTTERLAQDQVPITFSNDTALQEIFAGSTEVDINDLVRTARWCSDEGDVKSAANILRAVLDFLPNQPSLLNDLGAMEQQMWNLKEAAHYFEMAVKLKPNYTTAMNNLGVTLSALDEHSQAEKWYLQALEIDKDNLDSSSALVNLVSLYRDQGHLEKAVSIIMKEIALPQLDEGGIVISILCLFELKQKHAVTFREYEKKLTNEGRPLQLPSNRTFYSFVTKLQETHLHVLNELAIYLYALGHMTQTLIESVYDEFFRTHLEATLSDDQHLQLLSSSLLTSLHSWGSLHLIFQYFIQNDDDRQQELNISLQTNLNCAYITNVHLLTEDFIDFSQFNNWEKINQVIIGHRMTFQDAFLYANEYLRGELCILSNADIYFDSSLSRLGNPNTLDMENKLFALLRWEAGVLNPRIDSQDSWIFRSPVPTQIVNKSDFYMGLPRCDNRIAQLFLDAKFSVSSPSLFLVSHHIQKKEFGNGDLNLGSYSGESQVPGKISFVKLSDQWLF